MSLACLHALLGYDTPHRFVSCLPILDPRHHRHLRLYKRPERRAEGDSSMVTVLRQKVYRAAMRSLSLLPFYFPFVTEIGRTASSRRPGRLSRD